jgi:hypothetical protein
MMAVASNALGLDQLARAKSALGSLGVDEFEVGAGPNVGSTCANGAHIRSRGNATVDPRA